MPSLVSKVKEERIVHDTIPSTMELADDTYMLIKGACKGAKPPKSIEEEGGPFGTICLVRFLFSRISF